MFPDFYFSPKPYYSSTPDKALNQYRPVKVTPVKNNNNNSTSLSFTKKESKLIRYMNNANMVFKNILQKPSNSLYTRYKNNGKNLYSHDLEIVNAAVKDSGCEAIASIVQALPNTEGGFQCWFYNGKLFDHSNIIFVSSKSNIYVNGLPIPLKPHKLVPHA